MGWTLSMETTTTTGCKTRWQMEELLTPSRSAIHLLLPVNLRTWCPCPSNHKLLSSPLEVTTEHWTQKANSQFRRTPLQWGSMSATTNKGQWLLRTPATISIDRCLSKIRILSSQWAMLRNLIHSSLSILTSNKLIVDLRWWEWLISLLRPIHNWKPSTVTM